MHILVIVWINVRKEYVGVGSHLVVDGMMENHLEALVALKIVNFTSQSFPSLPVEGHLSAH